MSAFSTFAETYISQDFAVPDSLLYYISHNSVETLKKLLLTCKYFYLKYKILPFQIDTRGYPFSTDGTNKWIITTANQKTFPKMLWLCGIYGHLPPQKISELATKIYRSDITEIKLMCNIYPFKELKILFSSTKLKNVFMFCADIIYPDKSIVPIEVILQVLPYVDEFEYDPGLMSIRKQRFTSESAQNFAKIEHFTKFKKFGIHCVPANFDLPAFKCFVKNHVLLSGDITVIFEKETNDKTIVQFKDSLKNLVQDLKIEKYEISFDDITIIYPNQQ